MLESRTYNTKRNIAFSYIDTIATLLFQFVSRTVIVQILGEQYLGLSSLYTSILNVLNMAELGFAGAIVYNMYKPIANNDVNTVCCLLNYYRKVYRVISIAILVIGCAVVPFLPNLIKDSYPTDINIYLLYILYLLNTSISYAFFAYKSALLNALQRMDLSKIAYVLSNVTQYILQVFSLVILKNYYLFVFWMIVGTVFKNLLCAYISKKKFPQYDCKGSISKKLKKDIISRVKGLLICNISGVTYTTFDSIILSTFLGLKSVAVYNNYILVFNGIATFVTLIRNAMQASVGNSVAIESKEKNYKDMLLWQFLFSVIATWCVTCMLCLYQPFIEIWMGHSMLLPLSNVILICLWFFVSVIQHSYFLYLSGTGLWLEMRWPYIMSTITNLVLNIVLGKFMGITGIIFATVLSSFVFGLLWQCSIIFKQYFRISMKYFQIKQLLYLFVAVLSCLLAFFANSIILIDGILGLIVKGIISTVISVAIQYVFYFKTEEFKRGKDLFFRILHR